MKIITTFGSVAILAVIAAALLGPSTAMAENTALCEADESPCGSSISHAHYTSNDMRITIPEMNYQCDVLLLVSIGKLGAPQVLEGTFTYTNCNQECSREEVNGPSILKLSKTGHESGEVIGEGEIHSFCLGFIDCTYSFENLTGITKGPLLSAANNGEITWSEQTLTKVSGFLCPKTAKLRATFVPLSETYISS